MVVSSFLAFGVFKEVLYGQGKIGTSQGVTKGLITIIMTVTCYQNMKSQCHIYHNLICYCQFLPKLVTLLSCFTTNLNVTINLLM